MAKEIVIIGAGGHAKVIIDLIESMPEISRKYKVELLDDNIPIGTLICGKKITGTISNCLNYSADAKFIISIGNNKIRRKVAEKYQLPYISLIHPSAVIGKNVDLGQGTVVMANAVINCESKIGKHCIINTSATIDHECMLGDYVHISPGVHLGGQVSVGEESWIGIGSCVKNNVDIGKKVVVGAGTVVIKGLAEKCTAVGNPAKIIKWEEK